MRAVDNPLACGGGGIVLQNWLRSPRQQGSLEAYVLLARADQGLAPDYPAYRAKNRNKLGRYLEQFDISVEKPPAPQ